jgi:hypothetical protein
VTQPAGTIPAGASAVLLDMASHAGVIFTGEVVAVTRSDAAGFVDVRFHIDQAVRGCPKTGAYVLREWAGLWTGHPERYRVGQRFLMLLAARGAAGMSAPVGGMDGAIPLLASGAEPLANAAGVAPADDGAVAGYAVDLRWVQARVARSAVSSVVAAQARSVVATGTPAKPWPVDPGGTEWSGPVSPLAQNSAAAGQSPSLTAVLALLRGTNGAR